LSSTTKTLTVLDLLSLVSSGKAAITIGGRPLLSVQSDGRLVDVELEGIKEAGVTLSRIIRLEVGDANMLRGSESIARKLSHLGWRLTLYEKGDKVLTMGYGVSRLTGHISANPLKLKRLLDALG
jgi:hypothetical protein